MNSNIKKLQYLPYGTKEHDSHLKKIQKEIKSRDFILCTFGKFSKERNVFADNNVNLLDPSTGNMTYKSVFPGQQSVFESKDYFFVRRDQAEYNLDYRQVNVGLIVVDSKNQVLVLKKKNNFLSLVGGHTDFIKEAYDMSVKELTHFNIIKEFGEEVKTNMDYKELIPNEPMFYITEGHEMWDFLHSWFVYFVHVEDLNEYEFNSGENEKHETIIMNIDEVINDKKVKNSLKQALEMYKQGSEPKSSIKVSVPEETGSVKL